MEENNWQQRTELLLGEEKMKRIRASHVFVVGLGGVGAYAAEMLCRAGVGRMTIVDADTVQPTNMNRQLPAMHSTLGMPKAEVLAARYQDINPDIELTVLPVYLKDENIPELVGVQDNQTVVGEILAQLCRQTFKGRIIRDRTPTGRDDNE
jgi:tRNA threonylcarbamoyladenosine dehydratase